MQCLAGGWSGPSSDIGQGRRRLPLSGLWPHFGQGLRRAPLSGTLVIRQLSRALLQEAREVIEEKRRRREGCQTVSDGTCKEHPESIEPNGQDKNEGNEQDPFAYDSEEG